jgi:hypothetical protein
MLKQAKLLAHELLVFGNSWLQSILNVHQGRKVGTWDGFLGEKWQDLFRKLPSTHQLAH